MQNLLLKLARPAEIILANQERSIIALKSVIDGSFLLVLDRSGKETSRYNLLSNSFINLNWLDSKPEEFFTKSEDVSFWLGHSPFYSSRDSVWINKKLYHRRDCCRECDLHGKLLNKSEFAVCPRCSQSSQAPCSICYHPQHPHFEEDEESDPLYICSIQKDNKTIQGFIPIDELKHQLLKFQFSEAQEVE